MQTDNEPLFNDLTQLRAGRRQASQLRCIMFDSASLSGDFEHVNKLSGGSGERAFRLEVDAETSRIEEEKCAMLAVRPLIELCKYLVQEFGVEVVLCQKVRHIFKPEG